MMTSRLRSVALTITLAPFLVAAGCGGDDDTPAVTEVPAEAPPPDTSVAQDTTVEGCLRAGDQPGTFVLAALPETVGRSADRATRGEVATYTYLLVGDNLGQHVGRQVRVRGTVDDATDVEVDRESEAKGAPTQVEGDTVTPTVEIEEEAVIDVRRMRVAAVEATGGDCTPN